jgi:hypothetical protein
MPGVGQMRQRMLVVVPLVRRVRMAFVHVVDVALALDAGVAAARPVLVTVGGMNGVLGGHGSSLLW